MTQGKKLRYPDDPYGEREAAKYDNPLPSREYILQVLGEHAGPLSAPELCTIFHIRDPAERETFQFRLRAMERDGQLIRNRRGGYGLVRKMDLVRGRIIGHPDGFGFLVPEDGSPDVYLSSKQMRSLLHGDRAVVRLMGVDRRGRREGALVEVVERANKKLVGRFVVEHGLAFVIPSSKRIAQDVAIPDGMRGNAQDGQIVVVELIEQPSWRSQPIGRVMDVLGDHMAPGMEIDVAIHNYEIPVGWPADVEAAIAAIRPEVSEEDKIGREDLRAVPLVTIDGEDAKDFDDAVYAERHGKGWRLLVAIADVSHYVVPGSALDLEAHSRGNSVYFPGRVVPMLPEILSNGLCSLNPQVDRLCMVCEMFVTAGGAVRKKRVFPAVMNSHARFTYDEVADILVAKRTRVRARYKDLVPHLEELYALYQAFRQQREKRGAIDFETTETRILFGESKKIQAIVPVERNDAHRLIEECMIAANVATAEFLTEQTIGTLYRIHAGPTLEKLNDLRAFLGEFGLSLGGKDKPEPRHYAKLLDSIRGRPDARLIETVMLRSLSQAVYSPDNVGHFGLAVGCYNHFTSPIRRYPDLLVHRAIRRALGQAGKRQDYTHEELVSFGDHCSMTERRADEATRDAMDWLKCEYMVDKVGEVFPGTVTGVTTFGLFVQLDNIFVEGLVHVTALHNDYYHFDQAHHRLVGERTGRAYRLFDKVLVKVVRVSLDDKKIDFDLVEDRANQGREGRRGPGREGRGKKSRRQAAAAEGKPSKEFGRGPNGERDQPGRSRRKKRRKRS